MQHNDQAVNVEKGQHRQNLVCVAEVISQRAPVMHRLTHVGNEGIVGNDYSLGWTSSARAETSGGRIEQASNKFLSV